jgi:hypothetical protein
MLSKLCPSRNSTSERRDVMAKTSGRLMLSYGPKTVLSHMRTMKKKTVGY